MPDDNRQRRLRHRPGTPGRQSGRGREAVADGEGDDDLLQQVNAAWVDQDRAEAERLRQAELQRQRDAAAADAQRERQRQAAEAERQQRLIAQQQAAEAAADDREWEAEQERKRRKEEADAERQRKIEEKRRRAAARRQVDTAVIDGWLIDLLYMLLVRGAAAALLGITFGGTILAFHGGVHGFLRRFPLPVLADVGTWIGSILVHPSTLLAIMAQVIITIIQFRHRRHHQNPLWWVTVVVSVSLTFFGGLQLIPGWLAPGLGLLPWPPEESHQAASLVIYLVICVVADVAAERYLVRDTER